MKYHIITYGCQMNKSDSERISGILNGLGFKNTSNPNNADLVVFNLCSVRQSAIDRAIARIQNAKHHNPNLKILLTGCIVNKDRKRAKKLCDGIFNIDELINLPSILKKIGFKIPNKKTKIDHYLKIRPEYEFGPIAYIPIMTGCNNFCSYCVVPYTRGKEISRPEKDIICEVKNLVKNGVKEIWLLGQNVNSYKSKNGTNFPKLLKMVNDIPGNFWIRFTSSHPKDLTDEMIETFAKCKRITPYFNLPIQSGDNEILKAMNRPYSSENYKKLIKKVRDSFKKHRKGQESIIALSTDVIVGFPNENVKKFNNTKKIFKEIGFSAGYVSLYSPRSQSAAFILKDNISPSEKRKREKELIKIIENSALKFNEKFVGEKVDVLVLEKGKNFFLGKTRHHQTIKFQSDKNLANEFIKIKVIKATPYGLEGEKY
jgi:tRNA-2-methylthio-N6-dimethylallyladenosine synthase